MKRSLLLYVVLMLVSLALLPGCGPKAPGCSNGMIPFDPQLFPGYQFGSSMSQVGIDLKSHPTVDMSITEFETGKTETVTLAKSGDGTFMCMSWFGNNHPCSLPIRDDEDSGMGRINVEPSDTLNALVWTAWPSDLDSKLVPVTVKPEETLYYRKTPLVTVTYLFPLHCSAEDMMTWATQYVEKDSTAAIVEPDTLKDLLSVEPEYNPLPTPVIQ